MRLVSELNTLLQLVVEMVGETKCIAFVCFEQTLLPLLDMDDVHRDIELLQILEQSPMIVSSHFQQRLTWVSGT